MFYLFLTVIVDNERVIFCFVASTDTQQNVTVRAIDNLSVTSVTGSGNNSECYLSSGSMIIYSQILCLKLSIKTHFTGMWCHYIGSGHNCSLVSIPVSRSVLIVSMISVPEQVIFCFAADSPSVKVGRCTT